MNKQHCSHCIYVHLFQLISSQSAFTAIWTLAASIIFTVLCCCAKASVYKACAPSICIVKINTDYAITDLQGSPNITANCTESGETDNATLSTINNNATCYPVHRILCIWRCFYFTDKYQLVIAMFGVMIHSI